MATVVAGGNASGREWMRMGITGAGLGATVSGDVVACAARVAERVGFSTFWFGEHAVLFEAEAESRYPDRDPRRKARAQLMDPRTALADPVVSMSWAAAATSRIEIGSSIIILPQRNPVVLAKEFATLDTYCGGRVVLGVGTGWSVKEYAAIGADWTGRGRRVDEYVAVLRALWRDTPASFAGETIRFERAYAVPKPPRGDIPVIFGGNSDAVLQRVARCGDGWIPVKLDAADAAASIERLRRLTREAGRDPDRLRIIKSIGIRDAADDLERYRDAGVTEFKLSCYGDLPANERELTVAIEEYARRFVGRAMTL